MEFPTKEELDRYLRAHPDADKSLHSVRPEKPRRFYAGDDPSRTAFQNARIAARIAQRFLRAMELQPTV